MGLGEGNEVGLGVGLCVRLGVGFQSAHEISPTLSAFALFSAQQVVMRHFDHAPSLAGVVQSLHSLVNVTVPGGAGSWLGGRDAMAARFINGVVWLRATRGGHENPPLASAFSSSSAQQY